MRSQRLCQLLQHPIDFTLLFEFEFAQPVAELDGRRRFDKDRFSRAGAIVHDAANISTSAATHRHDPSPVANRDGEIADLVVRLKFAHLALEQTYKLALSLSQLTAHTAQVRRRIIANRAVISDGARDRFFVSAQIDQPTHQCRQECHDDTGPSRISERLSGSTRRTQERRTLQ